MHHCQSFRRDSTAYAALFVGLLSVAGCSDQQSPPAPPAAQSASKPPSAAVPLDWSHTLFDINSADLDGDGRIDLTLSAHVEGRVLPYFQQADGRFVGGVPLPEVGFHPNGTTTVVGDDGDTYLVLDAEGSGALRFYRVRPGESRYLGQIDTPAPYESVWVDWPSWDRSLAIAGTASARLRVIKGIQPQDPTGLPPSVVETSVSDQYPPRGLALARLGDGGATSTLVMATQGDSTIWGVAPNADGTLGVRLLWQFPLRDGPHMVLPVSLSEASGDDLIVLLEGSSRVALLRSDGGGGFYLHDLYLEGNFTQAGVVTVEANGDSLLWLSSDAALTVFRWPANPDLDQLMKPERRVLERPGKDYIWMHDDDLNADGHVDLVIGSSVGFIPPTVLYGPLWPQLDAIGDWLAGLKRDAESANSVAR